jgi:hypothetical protein
MKISKGALARGGPSVNSNTMSIFEQTNSGLSVRLDQVYNRCPERLTDASGRDFVTERTS